MGKPLNRRERSVANLYRRWRKIKARAKANYDYADRILKQVSDKMKVGVPVRITQGEAEQPAKCLVLLDNFAGKDLVWSRASAVRRNDLIEVVEEP